MGLDGDMALLGARALAFNLTKGNPALDPPPGLKSDFNKHEATADNIFNLQIVCIVLAVIFMAVRLYSRITITRLGADDYASLVALVFIFGFSGLIFEALRIGLGRHLWDVEAAIYWKGRFFMVTTIAEAFYYTAVASLKLSILLLYLRLFTTSRRLRIFIYVLMGVLVIYNALGGLLNLLACAPGGDVTAFWHTIPRFGYTCMDIYHINISMRFINAVTDVVVVSIPIPIVLGLHLPLKRRLAILAIFLTSFIAVASSIISLYYTWSVGNYVPDITWHFGDVIFWITMELYVGFFCSCMPSFKPLLQRILPILATTFSSLGSSKHTAGSSSGKSSTGAPRSGLNSFRFATHSSRPKASSKKSSSATTEISTFADADTLERGSKEDWDDALALEDVNGHHAVPPLAHNESTGRLVRGTNGGRIMRTDQIEVEKSAR